MGFLLLPAPRSTARSFSPLAVGMIALLAAACTSAPYEEGAEGSTASNEAPPAEVAPPADPAPAATSAQQEPLPPPLPESTESPVAAADSAPVPAPPAETDRVSPAAGTQSYVVQPGDTLMKLAFEHYGNLYDWRKIYESNRASIPNPARLEPGTTLQIEKSNIPFTIERHGDAYLIKQGDTLVSIAYDLYGLKQKWRKLWENNKQMIRDPNLIFAGFTLYYTMTAEEREFKNQQSASPPLSQAPEAPSETQTN